MFKPLLDTVLACALLAVLSPVAAVAAIAVKADSRGPVLFRQRRVGLQGKEFDIYKFRTMVRNAEQIIAELASLNEANGLLFKMRVDPRITRVGRFLRRYSLDELPMLFDVVRGDMSLIGPRPMLPSEVAAMDSHAVQRLLVKPGLTGPWQVSGRGAY